MLKIFITRHGETLWNVEKRLQGWKDSPLTEIGIKNAAALGAALEETPFDAVFCSPSERSVHTAKLIVGNQTIPFYLEQKLREINMGDWEGRTQSEIEESDGDSFHSFWNTPHLYNAKTGENFEDVQHRAVEAINEIKNAHQSGNILLVTHTVVIKCLLAYFKNLPLEKLWEPPCIHDTSLTVIEISQVPKILLEGDISHKNVAFI
ncbi:histidine phosphatase family protein [Heyndrickxia sp. MSNUG]|uniref:histidine phosphatase family protein n=1 Tax=Heyndrickxia sp. MSNUG TaxID=3136677 RepID=UPI003C2DA437